MHALGIKKTPRFPVKFRGHMWTPVKIGINLPLVPYGESDRRPAFMQDVKTDTRSGIGKLVAWTDQAFDFSHSLSWAVLSMHASGLCGMSFSRACAP